MPRDLGVHLYSGREALDAFDPPLSQLEEAERLDEIAEIYRKQDKLAFAALRAWLEWFRRECKPTQEKNDNVDLNSN